MARKHIANKVNVNPLFLMSLLISHLILAVMSGYIFKTLSRSTFWPTADTCPAILRKTLLKALAATIFVGNIGILLGRSHPPEQEPRPPIRQQLRNSPIYITNWKEKHYIKTTTSRTRNVTLFLEILSK